MACAGRGRRWAASVGHVGGGAAPGAARRPRGASPRDSQRSSVAYRCGGSTGLATWSSMPAARQAARSSPKALAVIARIGVRRMAGQRADARAWPPGRPCAASARPSGSGRSAGAAPRSTASTPSSATSTCKPGRCSSSSATSWLIGLSSTSSTPRAGVAARRSAASASRRRRGARLRPAHRAGPPRSRAVNQNALPDAGLAAARRPRRPSCAPGAA